MFFSLFHLLKYAALTNKDLKKKNQKLITVLLSYLVKLIVLYYHLIQGFSTLALLKFWTR